jgi:CDGSH-type Zn-finger protein
MNNDKKTVIEIRKNGPYVVTNVWKLVNSKGEALRTEEVMELCRCGHSTTKPYCSGAHKEHGFKDDKN